MKRGGNERKEQIKLRPSKKKERRKFEGMTKQGSEENKKRRNEGRRAERKERRKEGTGEKGRF